MASTSHPCPCGYLGDPGRLCVCTSPAIVRYQRKISGPLLDRVDIHLDVPRVAYEKLATTTLAEDSALVRQRVAAVRSSGLLVLPDSGGPTRSANTGLLFAPQLSDLR